MANKTLRAMGREIRLYNPDVGIKLAESWINNRYLRASEKYMWSYKMAESQFDTPIVYNTGTVTMTDGSATVTGSGTTFTSGMVGRLIKVSTYSYLISAFGSSTSITIDRNWENATESGSSFSIVGAVITPPTDFQSFVSVYDPVESWTLRLGLNSQWLNIVDPQRTYGASPRALVSRFYNSSDVATYELWPHPTVQRNYPYLYEKRIAALAVGGTPPPIIRSDVLILGALADLSRWPGTPGRPNPLADPNRLNWRMYDEEYRRELEKLFVEDQNIYLNNYMPKRFQTNIAPMDADYIQSHAF
jgi:hypothetical protein